MSECTPQSGKHNETAFDDNTQVMAPLTPRRFVTMLLSFIYIIIYLLLFRLYVAIAIITHVMFECVFAAVQINI